MVTCDSEIEADTANSAGLNTLNDKPWLIYPTNPALMHVPFLTGLEYNNVTQMLAFGYRFDSIFWVMELFPDSIPLFDRSVSLGVMLGCASCAVHQCSGVCGRPAPPSAGEACCRCKRCEGM